MILFRSAFSLPSSDFSVQALPFPPEDGAAFRTEANAALPFFDRAHARIFLPAFSLFENDAVVF